MKYKKFQASSNLKLIIAITIISTLLSKIEERIQKEKQRILYKMIAQ
jgi:hypothetical protein